jgi:hypothetical protein
MVKLAYETRDVHSTTMKCTKITMSVTTHPAGIFWGKSEQHFAISGEKNRAGGEKSRQYGGGMTGEVSRAIQGDFVRKVVECFGRNGFMLI